MGEYLRLTVLQFVRFSVQKFACECISDVSKSMTRGVDDGETGLIVEEIKKKKILGADDKHLE